MSKIFRIVSLLLFIGIFINCFAQTANNQLAYVLTVKGGIGPATEMYLTKGLQQAKQNQAALVIIQLDTPGGLVKSTREIIEAILQSPVPVVTYVAPSGAHAASAGTFILYASQIAAMAPGTNIGAATPIAMGSVSPQKDNQPTDTGMKKAQNDAVAFIRSLAELHGRNADWAEQAVSEAATLTAKQALKKQVINVIAPSLTNLLEKINGKTVTVLGEKQVLHTKYLTIKTVEPNFREKVLSIIASPTFAYILLLVGIYGIFFELMNPGMIFPGVIGVIALLVAVYGLHLLPINYIGIALILVGILLMILELFVTSFGVLALGGIVAFFIGSLFLFDRNIPGFDVALSIVIAITIVTAVFFLFVVRLAVRSQKRPIVSGAEELIGAPGVVLSKHDDELMIRVHGESWQAKSTENLSVGQQVSVVSRQGLLLIVTAADKTNRGEDK